LVGAPLVFGLGKLGFVGAPLEYAIAQFTAKMLTTVIINERNLRTLRLMMSPFLVMMLLISPGHNRVASLW